MCSVDSIPLVVLINLLSVKAAATYSGYSLQYIRRLLRRGKLKGVKIGQVWLIVKEVFDVYLKAASQALDRRFGPHQHLCFQKFLGVHRSGPNRHSFILNHLDKATGFNGLSNCRGSFDPDASLPRSNLEKSRRLPKGHRLDQVQLGLGRNGWK